VKVSKKLILLPKCITFGFCPHIFPLALQECVVKYCTLPFSSSFYLELIRIKYVDMLAGFIAMVTTQYIRYLIYSNACKIKKKSINFAIYFPMHFHSQFSYFLLLVCSFKLNLFSLPLYFARAPKVNFSNSIYIVFYAFESLTNRRLLIVCKNN
jgi:hypothetical protein